MAANPLSEYLITDGRGGFFCGTICGQLTRRWHGWWFARNPPRDRVRVLAGWEESFISRGQKFQSRSWLDGSKWRHREFPPDSSHALDLGKGVQVTTRPPQIMSSCLQLEYVFQGNDRNVAVPLQLALLLPFRPEISLERNGVMISGGSLSLHVSSNSMPITLAGEIEEVEIELELEKDCESVWTEKVYRTPRMQFTMSGAESRHAVLLSIPHTKCNAEHRPSDGDPLARAAGDFIVSTSSGRKTILAGYPWFTDWGRDTMIALPGLCLSTNRFDDAADIIDHFLEHLNQGIIPNLFPEYGEQPMYNTIDATLWLINSAFRLHRASGDFLNAPRYARLQEIIEWHLRGTHHNIHVDADGLLAGGSEGSQLTWMDVKVDGHVPTPRHGKAVEIQGLWYNALMLMAEAADWMKDSGTAERYTELARRCRDAFAARFFDPQCFHAADVIDRDGPGTADLTLRPNMVIPFALTHNIIPTDRRAQVLRTAAAKLLTPRGLRTLSPDDPRYKPVYRGDVKVRDRAYHQGTVWMWLIMPYLRGVNAERRNVPELAAQAPEIIRGLLKHFSSEGCINQCSEIFDGDPPHTPRGCFAQAWSTAAVIEVAALKW